MDKKLNRTIGYVKTTEVVSNETKTTKVVKKKQVNNLKSITVPAIGELINKDLKQSVDKIEVTVDIDFLNEHYKADVDPIPSLKDLFPDGMEAHFKEKFNNLGVLVPHGCTITELNAEILPVTVLEDRSKRIADWLKSHPGFKWSWMCTQVGLNKSNFKRLLQLNGKIKEEKIESIEKIISNYGYKKY